MRLLNSVPRVFIAGESHLAFEHLRLFYESMSSTLRTADGSFVSVAWAAPKGLDDIVKCLRRLMVDLYNPNAEYDFFGFKEIRFGGDYQRLEANLEFLRTLFPDLKIIFNVRDTEDCADSRERAWGENAGVAKPLLEEMRATYMRYLKAHAHDCFWLPYEDLKPGSASVRGMFRFLGITFEDAYERAFDVVLK